MKQNRIWTKMMAGLLAAALLFGTNTVAAALPETVVLNSSSATSIEVAHTEASEDFSGASSLAVVKNESTVAASPEALSADRAVEASAAADSSEVVSSLPTEPSAQLNAPYTITAESELEALFPDAAFRAIVFEAVKNGKNNAIGTDLVDALLHFDGSINAAKKGIQDVHGLEYLRHAETVDLNHNEISDFTFLSLGESYYGVSNEAGVENRNVTWILSGNPFTNIPENFGGCLIVERSTIT